MIRMSEYWIEYQFADWKETPEPILKLIHLDDCLDLKDILRDKKSGPYSTHDEALEVIKRRYPDAPLGRCTKCL